MHYPSETIMSSSCWLEVATVISSRGNHVVDGVLKFEVMSCLQRLDFLCFSMQNLRKRAVLAEKLLQLIGSSMTACAVVFLLELRK